MLVFTAIVRTALAITVCQYRYLAVLCLGLLFRQFSRIFAVPRPIATGYVAADAVSSHICLGQIGNIFFQTSLYLLFCDALPHLAYRKR